MKNLTDTTLDRAKPLPAGNDLSVKDLAIKDLAARKIFVPLLITAAVALGLVLTFAQTLAVWQTGVFHDPDDAMRMVQVRALLAGQSWFDMTAYRLDPPGGSIMHWSRAVDLPLAVLIKALEFFMAPNQAERLTRLIFPLLLQGALYAAMARLARRLLGRDAILLTVVAVFLSGPMLGQFQPGRIDHHAPQIVLLTFMLTMLIEAIETRRLLPGVCAGGCAALSLAISLENLPFIFTLWGLTGAVWVWRGQSMRHLIRGVALGLLIGLPLCFLATVGPAYWFKTVPDAFSFGQLIAGVAGALTCLGLTSIPAITDRVLIRAGLAAFAAFLIFGLVMLAAPEALLPPFAGIDPLVNRMWLANVREAWSVVRLVQEEPATAVFFVSPLLLSLAALIAAIYCETDRNRCLQWMMVAATLLTGLATGFWMIRILATVGPIASLGGVWLVMRLTEKLKQINKHFAAICSFMLLLPFASIPWALAIAASGATAGTAPRNSARDCHASAAFAAFRALPAGLILAPIDAGSHLLAFTAHSVLAAPYHRNNHGNKIVLEALLAPPGQSRAIVMESGAKYVAVCAGLGETSVAGKHKPESLAEALIEGHIPDWLEPVPAANTPYKIFTVLP